MADSDDLGTIRIERRQFAQDLFRRYAVFIDQILVGRIASFATGEYRVVPGRHSVQLRIATTGNSCSDNLPVEIGAGETRVLRTMRLELRKLILLPLGIVNPSRFAPRPWIKLCLVSRQDE
jgi:hypothetical protein